jgi:hypothetical protein
MVSLSSFGPPLLSTLLAALWLVAASAAAHRLVGTTGTALDRTVATGLTGGFLGIAAFLLVGPTGLLDRPVAPYLAWGALAAVACFLARVSPFAALRTFGTAARETLDLVFAVRASARPALIALAVPAVLLLHEQLVIPPTAWDALTYHLTYPLHWLQSGELTTLPFGAGDPSPEYYPLGTEMLFYFGFVATGSDWWTAFAQVPALLGAAAAIAAIALRCGSTREEASLAAVLWMSLPLILRSAFEPMVDVFLAAFLFSTLFFLLRLLEMRTGEGAERGMLLLVAMGAGLAAGTKYTGPFLAVAVLAPPGVLVLRRLFRAPATDSRAARSSALTLAAAALLAVVAGGYVYARNLWIGANPFLPMEIVFGGSTIFPGSVASDAYFQHPTARLTLARFFASPRALLDFGPAFALLLAVPFAAQPERGSIRMTAIVLVLVLFVFLVVIPYRENRHLFVPLGLCCALLGPLPARLRRAIPWLVILHVPPTLYYWGKDLVLGGVHPRHAVLVPAIALVVIALSPGWRRAIRRRLPGPIPRRPLPAAGAAVLVAGLWTALALAHEGYHRHRYDGWLRFWSTRFESREGFRYRRDRAETAQAWGRIAELTRDTASTIAYVGNNLPYPLTGYGLANEVLVVPRANGSAFTGFRKRDFAREPTESAEVWLERTEELGVDYLCVFRQDAADDPARALPIEAEWADARPGTFELIYRTDAARIYRVLRQNRTSISMTGTSISTPTTVASAAPDCSPNSITAVAIATSKWLDAPISADGAASR